MYTEVKRQASDSPVRAESRNELQTETLRVNIRDLETQNQQALSSLSLPNPELWLLDRCKP
jgi:hypothetical protein